jgi:hypothetical protein
MLSTQSAAANRPGASRPHWLEREPSTGPIATPAFVAAESQPSAFARSSGAVASATYAWMTLTVPPPAPCTSREMNSSASECAKPKMT